MPYVLWVMQESVPIEFRNYINYDYTFGFKFKWSYC